jgi:hypothetical protein
MSTIHKKDSVAVGAIVGILLPAIALAIFFLTVSHRFDSYTAAIKHFLLYNLLYKVLTMSLMPNVALFFYWSKKNQLNQARGTLLMTLFYGIFVILLFFN